MTYPIEQKLVIAVASSALFDLTDSQQVYNEQGVDAYRKYQEENIDNCFPKGVAFPFVRRLLKLNEVFKNEEPIEIVLLSKNSPETGLRAFRSIKQYGLNISRAAFFSGESPYEYLPAFNVSLFLSADEDDVNNAIAAGYAAGRVLNTAVVDDEEDVELRLAFDFDGVIADDEAEKVFQAGDLSQFQQHEALYAQNALKDGLLADLLTHERMIHTLKSMGVEVNQAFFMGGIQKARVLNIMKPHIFFDDQIGHLDHIDKVPAVHIPFGVTNRK